jgi:hypothetical protein
MFVFIGMAMAVRRRHRPALVSQPAAEAAPVPLSEASREAPLLAAAPEVPADTVAPAETAVPRESEPVAQSVAPQETPPASPEVGNS